MSQELKCPITPQSMRYWLVLMEPHILFCLIYVSCLIELSGNAFTVLLVTSLMCNLSPTNADAGGGFSRALPLL